MSRRNQTEQPVAVGAEPYVDQLQLAQEVEVVLLS